MKTADLVDAHMSRLSLCNLPFRQFGAIRAFHGPIATVKCFEDNALLKAELAQPGEGRVLVVDGGGSTRTALIGDMIAASLMQNGWAGAILNGCIRDSAEIEAMDVGLFCLGTTPMKSRQDRLGYVGIPVSFGGVAFRPGAYVYADADGVLVSDGLLTV